VSSLRSASRSRSGGSTRNIAASVKDTLFVVGRVYSVLCILYCIVHFLLLLGVYTEYWAFSICNGHSF
jgi:hypothetical protein